MPGQFPPILKPPRHRSYNSAYDNAHNARASFGSADTAANAKPSLDFTQKLEKKLAAYNASGNLFKRWLLEIISWIVSALCMGAIVGIYLHVNGKILADNQTAINLVNVLGKVAAAALIVPTSEALGQLKWHWFHDSNAIWDFEIFDKASRGPWGAALLLYRTKGRSLAALGALLIVLLLAIDTFFQQVADYSDQWTQEKSMTAHIPRTTTYEPTYNPAYQQGIEISSEDKVLAPVMREYFYNNGTQPVLFGNGTRPDVPLSCPTSKCTWPQYDTLAVCSSCKEVSHLLDLSYLCLNTTIDWSVQWMGPLDQQAYPTGTVCGTYLNATSESPILLTGYIASQIVNMSSETLLTRLVPLTDFATKAPLYGYGSLSYRDVRYPLLDALIASVPNSTERAARHDAPLVHECMLSWCVRTVQSTYEWGRYTETVNSEYLEPHQDGDSWPWSTYEVETGTFIVYSPNRTLRAGPTANRANSGSKYHVNNVTTANIMNIFDDIFPASYVDVATSGSTMRFKNYPGIAPVTRKMAFNPWLAPNNITRHMERLATSMTNILRSSALKVMVPGDAHSMKTFIIVKWEWLIFPFALLLLTFAFLVSTIRKTSADTATGVWKTSAMPTLIYGLPQETRGKLAASATWSSSHEDTKKLRIRLLPSLGWRVSGQNFLRSPLLPVRKNQPPPGWI